MDRSKMRWVLGIATAFFLLVAVTLLILGIVLEMAIAPRIILIAMSVVSLALTAEIGYLLFLNFDKTPNYFLFNTQTKRNMPVQKLTFAVVNARMNKFLSGYAASEGKIWNERVLDNPYLEMPNEFRPLVGYKLLYSLADKDAEAGWACLEKSSDGTLAFICEAIKSNGDDEFAANIEQMTKRPMNIKIIRDYLVRNKKYMQYRMTKYVADNIELF